MIGSLVVGGAGLIQGKKASDKADESYAKGISEIEKYMAQAGMHGKDALEFAQGMLDDWEGTFGGIQDNLSDYYDNLDPELYATQYKSNLYDNIDKELADMNESLGAAGLMSSGMRAQNEKEAAFAKATGGAQADIMAEDKVMEMKQGFVNSGANQLASANASMSNAHSNLANISVGAAGTIGGAYTGMGNVQASDAGGYIKGGLDIISGGLGAFASSDSGKSLDGKIF